MTTHTTRRGPHPHTGRAATITGGIILAAGWTLTHTWRRLLPAYWAALTLTTGWIATAWPIRPATLTAATVVIVGVTTGWPARSVPVRLYRAVVPTVLGGWSIVTATVGPTAMTDHPTTFVFGPCLTAAILGWPWWYHLTHPSVTTTPTPPSDATLTARWAAIWQTRVAAEGVCPKTRLTDAREPRPGVIEATITLAPGTKPATVTSKGPDVETALELDEGSIGWRPTGKAAKLVAVIVRRSHIAGGVPWNGPTYRDGRCEITTYADGTPGLWTFSRPHFGTLNGLVVGSTGSGKSRALGVLIANLLAGGWMVVVGDPQNGQSLPAWRHAVGEYHDTPETVAAVLRRYHTEVMSRSRLLADAGIDTYDEHDPRIGDLNLKPMMLVIDECQLVLRPGDKLVAIVEDLMAIDRKTGCGVILATQLPQMASLGGSIRIRDAATAGNALIMRLSNRGSGTTILPDGFAGDPFAIPAELNATTTAGMGYLRSTTNIGMLSRVPAMDETTTATNSPHIPVQWLADEDEASEPSKTTDPTNGGATVTRLRTAFGVNTSTTTPAGPASTREWVLTCLRRTGMSAQALLDRPDCPVNQTQLYTVLADLVKTGRIKPPTQRGGQYTINQ